MCPECLMNIRQMSYDVSVKNFSPRVNSGVVGTLSYGAQGGDSFGHKYGKIKNDLKVTMFLMV